MKPVYFFVKGQIGAKTRTVLLWVVDPNKLEKLNVFLSSAKSVFVDIVFPFGQKVRCTAYILQS